MNQREKDNEQAIAQKNRGMPWHTPILIPSDYYLITF
jgi:hypothetical protein